MGTVETRSSKTPSGCSSPSPENDKNELREALCALKDGFPENGVGFSSHNGSQGFETKVSVHSDFVGREVEDDNCQGLADSEMNGVSSLLKMRGSSFFGVGMEGGRRKDLKKSEDEDEDEDDQYGKKFTMDVPIVETSENKDLEIEDLGNECYEFSVGDFVWGKIKCHPWWPGRIYDHTNASDFALKLRQKNRVLVAYFGDGTFAWCHPSQLKPFEENFEDMVMQSGSRAFVNAVQEAVDEVGRLLNLKMSYCCAAKKTKSEFAPQMAKNSGIKEGHLVPENGIERLSNILIDPAELLSRVKQIAKVIAVTSILELEVLKARLSAFYRSRGGYELPNYVEPQLIPGLEDSSVDETVDVGNSKGAVEAPFQGPFEEAYSTLPASPKSGYSQGISGNHWRKQKSIAEIMGKEDKGVSTKNKEGDASKDVMVSRKKRKGSEDSVPSKPVQKRKCFHPSTHRKVASAENGGSCGGKENSDKSTLLQLKEKKEAFGNENASSESKKVTDEGNTKEENEKGFLSRKRKKSKYLSPPFTTPTRGQRKGKGETESLKASSNAPPSKPITRAFDQQLLKSPVLLKCNGEAFQANSSKKLAIEPDLPNSSNYRTPDDEKNRIIDPTVIQIPSREFLSKVRYAAINPQILMDIHSLQKLVAFTSVYRSSIYRHGSYYKIYSKHQPGRKRKKPESDLGMLTKDQNRTDHISSPNEDSELRKRRWKETTSGVPEEKQSAKSKTPKKGTGEATAALVVSFGQGSSLPSKYDLVTVYSKFGALNESETAMFSSNHTAQVSFLKASDAEKALSHSQIMSPFGSSQVSFRLQYLSAGSKSVEHGKKSKSEASKLNYIKQKLLGMTSMLEALDGKSPDMKTKLEREMQQLLEDLNKMVESSSS